MFKILVVDDDIQVLSGIERYLSLTGFDVTAVRAGIEVKSVILENRFDAAIIDLILPGGNGLEIIKEIRMISPETIIFTWTGYPLIYSTIDKEALGISECITKPCKVPDLLDLLNTRLEIQD